MLYITTNIGDNNMSWEKVIKEILEDYGKWEEMFLLNTLGRASARLDLLLYDRLPRIKAKIQLLRNHFFGDELW